jgi:L-serine dehydratase
MRIPSRTQARQAEIGVASAMAAAFIAQAMGSSPLVIENAAESALEHHLGMTCDPVAGYVQVPCIERSAFGAVKAWTAFMVAANEIASRHRVDLELDRLRSVTARQADPCGLGAKRNAAAHPGAWV